HNVDLDPHSGAPEGILKSLDTDASAVTHFDYEAGTISVWANGADQGPFSGMSYEVILHEFIHAATSPYLDYVNEPSMRGTRTARLGRDLRDVLEAIRQHIQEKSESPEGLSEEEQAMLSGEANTLQNEHELLAWTLSNPKVMQYLDTVPYQGKVSIFRRFVEAIRSILGLSAKNDTALGAVLRIGDELLSTGERETAKIFTSEPKERPNAKVRQIKKATPAEKINKGLFKAQMASQASGFLEGLDEAAAGAKLENKEKLKAFTDAVGSHVSPAIAETVPTSWLVDSIKKMRPALGSILEGIDKLDQAMRGMRNSMNKAMRRRVKEVERFTNKYGQDVLSQAMTINRVNRFNPAEYKTRQEALQKDPVLDYYTQKGSKGGIRARTAEINAAWDVWERLGK
ncbi:MAG: hypothetical protein EBZ48_16785, partial [Proteobacteria bacterium]|nr:hypothetical protein [Pseudomonadota bacterium]